ncbi:hypothetical protein [Psychrobacillus sp. FJAT-21963]|uniref:hypothetical protein n=1 Tax=Psychrobacillus sp. FJAT-21963 TaxID=1712028 RepID=UPI000701569E|nr:hypothetical protein [Psychrobacillus sp. FJAT-21963]KQL35932.1 hypothetical protein AN959_08605 [Psychrobacillus sp. FJAT-21963]
MKRYIIFIMAFLLVVVVPNNAKAEIEGYDIVAKSNKENITLYAKKMNDLYYDFKLDFKGEVYSRPFWINVANNFTYAPQIFYEDINRDQKKELIVILNQGYGTGVLQQEIYVYGYTNGLIDILVDNPITIINKNVKTKLTTEIAEIIVGDKVYKVDIRPLEVKPTNLFQDISFGSSIKYEVIDQLLTATISAQISPAGFVGQLVIVYEYREKMYQAKSIEFQPSPDL